MTVYKCIEETKCENEQRKTVYSISYEDKIISDICSDRKLVEHLVDVFNKENLDPIHLPFVLEELL